MARLRPVVVVSLRRVLLGLAGLGGAALALTLALGAGSGSADGAWAPAGGLGQVFASGVSAAAPSPAPGFGSVTVMVVPVAAGRQAVLLRDGLSAGRFDGGPLTVAVRAGDTLGVRGAMPQAELRVLAVSPGVLAPGARTWPLAPGGTLTLPPVRLAPPSGS